MWLRAIDCSRLGSPGISSAANSSSAMRVRVRVLWGWKEAGGQAGGRATASRVETGGASEQASPLLSSPLLLPPPTLKCQ